MYFSLICLPSEKAGPLSAEASHTSLLVRDLG